MHSLLLWPWFLYYQSKDKEILHYRKKMPRNFNDGINTAIKLSFASQCASFPRRLIVCVRVTKSKHSEITLCIIWNLLTYNCVDTRFSWKINMLTKILSWNVTKGGLFFNTVSFAVHTLLPSVLQCLNSTCQKVINNR